MESGPSEILRRECEIKPTETSGQPKGFEKSMEPAKTPEYPSENWGNLLGNTLWNLRATQGNSRETLQQRPGAPEALFYAAIHTQRNDNVDASGACTELHMGQGRPLPSHPGHD